VKAALRARLPYAGLIASVVALDQVTKAVVVARTTPLASAVRPSKSMRPSHSVTATTPRADSTGTRRAAAGSGPSARKAAAIAHPINEVFRISASFHLSI